MNILDIHDPNYKDVLPSSHVNRQRKLRVLNDLVPIYLVAKPFRCPLPVLSSDGGCR